MDNELFRNWDEYQQLAQRTASITSAKPDKQHNAILGLFGEVGEVCDLIKKFSYQSGDAAPLPGEKILKECGDVLWYIAELCTAVNVRMATVGSRCAQIDYEQVVCAENRGALTSKNKRLKENLYQQATAAAHEVGRVFSALGADLSPFDPTTVQVENAMRHLRGLFGRLHYILAVAGYTPEAAAVANIQKLRARYPEGFDPARSLNRAPGDE